MSLWALRDLQATELERPYLEGREKRHLVTDDPVKRRDML